MQQLKVLRLALVLALIVPAMALAQQPAQAGERIDVVALGDSYTSGNGALKYEDKDCYRSANAYVHRYSLALRQKGIESASYNYACFGKWTYDVAGQITEAGDRLKNADIVMLTIGGNDADFTSLVVNCVAWVSEFNDCTDNFNNALEQLDSIVYRTRNIMFDINKAAPNAQIVLVGYPYLIADCSRETTMIRSLQSAFDIKVRNMVSSLDHAPLATAGRVRAVSMLDAFIGHEVCGSGDQYIRGSADTFDHKEWWHPNREGHQLMADMLVQSNVHKRVLAPTQPVSGEYVYSDLPLACGVKVHRATTYDSYNYNGTVIRHGYAIDLPVNDGTPVVAPTAGTVYVHWDPDGYGRFIDLVDSQGITHRMAHLRERASVSHGQRVSKGQQLGLVGVTGATTGPHLHYERRQGSSQITIQFAGTPLSWSQPTTLDGDRYTLHSLISGNCGNTTTVTSDGGYFETPIVHLQSGGAIGAVKPNGRTQTLVSGIMTPKYRVSCDYNNNGKDETYSAEFRNNRWYIMRLHVVDGVGHWREWRRDFMGRGIRGLSCGDRDGDGKDEIKVHVTHGGEIWLMTHGSEIKLVGGISIPFARTECDVDRDGRDEMISLEKAGDKKWRLMVANFSSTGRFQSWSRFMPDSRLSGHDLTNMSCGDYNGDGIFEVKLFSRSTHTMYRVSSHGNPNDRVLSKLWGGLTTPSFMVECDANRDGNDEIYSVEDRAEGLFIMQGQLRPEKTWKVFSTDFSGKKITHMSCGAFDLS